MKNCVPALSALPGISVADTAPRVCFSSGHLGLQQVEAAGSVPGARSRILRHRIAALDDPVLDHSKERRAVVTAGLGGLDEERHVVRRLVGEQVHDDRPGRGVEDGLLLPALSERLGERVFESKGPKAGAAVNRSVTAAIRPSITSLDLFKCSASGHNRSRATSYPATRHSKRDSRTNRSRGRPVEPRNCDRLVRPSRFFDGELVTGRRKPCECC